MYLSLYRKWRPQNFDEMCGQTHITDILKKQCADGRVSHAYLFCGSRGTGKTSTAKILAKAVNCENPIDGNPCNKCPSCTSINNGSATDVLEIDAASNNGVNNIRDLRDEVLYPPTLLKKRVYIIDEVHMLSDAAFNALLKTLEEPPEYVVFIFATTELDEIPSTIISRCIRFDFSRIDVSEVIDRLEFVAEQESLSIDRSATELIAALADGSMRDALSLLEACSNGHTGTLTDTDVRSVLGLAGEETVCALLDAASKSDVPAALDAVEEIHRSSKDVSVFLDDLSVAVRDLLVDKQLAKYGREGRLKDRKLSRLVSAFTNEQLFNISSILEETQNRIAKYTVNKRTILELSVIRMCDLSLSDSPRALAARISALEKKLSALAATGFSCVSNQEQLIVKDEYTPETPENSKIINTQPVVTDEKPFAFLPELIEALNNAPHISGFIQQSHITTDGDVMIIKGDSLSLQMIKTDIPALSEAVASVTGLVYRFKFVEISANNKPTKTPIDEL